MITVSNQKVIQRISKKSLKANRLRNLFAIIAIALTTTLFTALFTTVFSMNYSWQQETMRQMGGNSMGAFKDVTLEQIEELSAHPLIQDYGYNRMLSLPYDGVFQKNPAEIRYFTDNDAKSFFAYPEVGTMPRKRLDIVMDTELLKAMGIEPKIGAKVTLRYPLGEVGAENTRIITETFTLCGYYEKQTLTSHEILLSKQYVDEILKDYEPTSKMDSTGNYTMSVNFKNSFQIERKMKEVLADCGYQCEDASKDNFIDIGVSWAHTTSNIQDDPSVYIGMGILLLLIIFTGYLIIYNIFQISVNQDIRFYGLLKTIGTTGKQLKKIIRKQAFFLCIVGIPIGLFIGFFFGKFVVPMIMSNLTITKSYVTMNPWIFICSALFAFFTVRLSLRKPAKIAAKVSPVEAVRYVERDKKKKRKNAKKKQRSYKKGNRLFHMAVANLMRTKKKTVLIIISLSLSCILICATYVFAIGFDMDKFLNRYIISDFYVAKADYFIPTVGLFGSEDPYLTEEIVETIKQQEGVEEVGIARYNGEKYVSIIKGVKEFYEQFTWGQEQVENSIDIEQDGIKDSSISLYGYDSLFLKQLECLEGTLDEQQLLEENGIIVLVTEDDYGNPDWKDLTYQLGDTVELKTLDNYEYMQQEQNPEEYELVVKQYHTTQYKVMGIAKVKGTMTSRAYGRPMFALPTKSFLQEVEKEEDPMMSCMVEAKESNLESLEAFFKNYVEQVEPTLNYESRYTYVDQFKSFRDMFFHIGLLLSITIGIIGIMNYINGILTSIIARKREFATMQSIGMTGKQLKTMLIMEGLIYAMITLGVSMILSLFVEKSVFSLLGNILWFFTPKMTLLPFVILIPVFCILGIFIPILAYKGTNKESIVEQLRDYES